MLQGSSRGVAPGTGLGIALVHCPVCRGEVHPIAGRCKHCKADLLRWREPAADAAPAAAPRASAAGNGKPGALSAAPLAATIVIPGQRATEPGVTSGGTYLPRPTVWWRRWPILLAVLATAAIVVCLFLLFSHDDRHGKPIGIRASSGAASDALSDRMETQPLPDDPWGGATTTVPTPPDPDPPAGRGGWGAAPPTMDADNFDNDDLAHDPAGNDADLPQGLGGLGALYDQLDPTKASPQARDFVERLGAALCSTLDRCHAPEAARICSVLRNGAGMLPLRCDTLDADAANRCIQELGAISCDDPTSLLLHAQSLFSQCLAVCH